MACTCGQAVKRLGLGGSDSAARRRGIKPVQASVTRGALCPVKWLFWKMAWSNGHFGNFPIHSPI
uniref:Uncharacterized protein n=1 Tax=Helianthus annuus TaxID=4232 RepID=A0A251UIZ6_HELAN